MIFILVRHTFNGLPADNGIRMLQRAAWQWALAAHGPGASDLALGRAQVTHGAEARSARARRSGRCHLCVMSAYISL